MPRFLLQRLGRLNTKIELLFQNFAINDFEHYRALKAAFLTMSYPDLTAEELVETTEELLEALSSDGSDGDDLGFDLTAIEESLDKIADDVAEAEAVESNGETTEEEEPSGAHKQSTYLGVTVFWVALYVMRHVF